MSTPPEPFPAPEGPPQGPRRGARTPSRIPALLRSRGFLIGAAVLVVLLLAGGGTAFAMDKRITLTVDGKDRTVHTFGSSVADVLESAEVELGEHDKVVPAAGTQVSRGQDVEVRTGRKFTLELDGKAKSHWVTAFTVDEALKEIGKHKEPMSLSVKRTAAVPKSGLEVTARSARDLVIQQDTKKKKVSSTEPTVGEVLKENGIDLGKYDKVKPKAATEPTDGMVIKVMQVIGKPKTKEVPIEAGVQTRENDDLPKGEKKVVRKPKDGKKKVTVATVMKGGKKTEHVLKEKVLKKPVKGITEVGTKEEAPEVDSDVGGPADSLNWAGLAQCESGGNPKAVNSAGGYYGLYQFSEQTWASTGGSGLPSDASPSEQTMRAKKLYNMVDGNWQSQWPECGKHL
ncbi:resuscitation-promoting factor [Murinocardiopsis flavida]|uniref:resuscitation-promoting factor n=1 Tax=Murinocardiopsis flavida TaxID=645275 RepID=UPI001FE31AC0|nr:resuscitation-promoting factor [Murinocardiopsis flavida]